MSGENTAVVIRLYPNKAQRTQFAKTFGCCRKIWNLMLADKFAHLEETGKTLMTTPAQYKEEYPFLKEVDSLALANEQLHLQTAWKGHYFDKRTGKPKFKSKRRDKSSYTTNLVNGNIVVGEDAIKLPKVGVVKAVVHRQIPNDWKLKSVTVRQDRDGKYYASLLYEHDGPEEPTSVASAHIGLDYKSQGLYVDSNGHSADMPRYYREAQEKLACEQRKLSRKQGAKKGETPSKNYEKQRQKVAKVAKHVANQRKDFLHKESTSITKKYGVVSVEDLNMRGMARSLRLGKSVHDNGWGMFIGMLEYKQHREGHYFVKVDKWFPSSQLCHTCGYKNPIAKNLSVRTITCPVCGTTYDRDHNAAMNIDSEGLRILS